MCYHRRKHQAQRQGKCRETQHSFPGCSQFPEIKRKAAFEYDNGNPKADQGAQNRSESSSGIEHVQARPDKQPDSEEKHNGR
jgi:hypothetical protein